MKDDTCPSQVPKICTLPPAALPTLTPNVVRRKRSSRASEIKPRTIIDGSSIPYALAKSLHSDVSLHEDDDDDDYFLTEYIRQLLSTSHDLDHHSMSERVLSMKRRTHFI